MEKCIGISLSTLTCCIVTAGYQAQNMLSFHRTDGLLNDHFFNRIKPLCDKKTQIVVGIPSEKVMQQDFQMDVGLSDDEIGHFLQTQSLQFFGYSAETLCIDYQTIKTDHDQQTVHVVAAQKKMIHEMHDAFKRANLFLTAIDLNEYAAKRARNYCALHPDFLIDKTMTAAFGLCLWTPI